MSAEPTFLDGSASNRGQGQEGNFDDLDAWLDIKRDFFSKMENEYRWYVMKKGQKLSNDDYLILWEDKSYFDDFNPTPKWTRLTPSQRVKHIERYEIVLDKIDHEATKKSIDKQLLNAKANAKKSNHAGHELGAREFTLTYSPKWFNDEEARDLFRKAINKVIKYYDSDIVQLRAVGEVGSNGLSHVHCFYKLRGGLKISDKNFKRAYKYWNPKKVTSRTGHEGGHHANVRNESDFQGYIDKDVEVAWMDVYYPPSPADPSPEVDPA